MLALALGFLGAVVVVGAFCAGVFLGCWLCGEEGTPARIGTGRERRRKRAERRYRRRKRPYRIRCTGGYGTALDTAETGGRRAEESPYSDWRETERKEEERGYTDWRETERKEAERGYTHWREAEEQDAERQETERQRLREEQAAFRALQHYSAEHAYGLCGASGFDGTSGRSGLY